MAHIHRIVSPRCRSEKFLAEDRASVGFVRDRFSLHAAAELVCRGRVVVLLCMIRVLLLWGVLCVALLYIVYLVYNIKGIQCKNRSVFNFILYVVARNNLKLKSFGLGHGSSSQYRIYWLRHMPVHWTRPVYWWLRRTGRGFAATPVPPAGEGAPPEAAPEGPAGGALPEARFYAIWLH